MADTAHSPPAPALPWRPTLALLLCNSAHFYAICSIFSYCGIMCADLGWARDRDHAGDIAGFVQSANVLGRIPTSFLWGIAASRFGYRACMCCSMASVCIGSILFGFITTQSLSIAARVVFLGMGNGLTTLFPCLVAEIGGKELQTKLTGVVFAGGNFIQLFGPALGGWTYGLWPDHPAAIPNIIGALLTLVAMAASMWLPSGLQDSASVESAASEDNAGKPSFFTVLRTSPLPLLLALRSLHGFSQFSFFEVVPLWAISSVRLGGLALSQRDVGTILTCSALGSTIFLLFGMGPLTNYLGLRRALALANALCVGCWVFMPYSPNVFVMIFLEMLLDDAIQAMIICLIACINNAVAPNRRAVINGVFVTSEALCKGIAPLASATCFAWTLSHWSYAGHGAFFFGMSGLHVLQMLGACRLSSKVEVSPRAESSATESLVAEG